jgi:peptide/nickel transport system permease protein
VRRYLLRRAAASLLLLWLVVTLTFVLLHAAPGSPLNALVGGDAPGGGVRTGEQMRRLERIYGLDRPLPEQYLRWLGNAVRFEWGTSFASGRPVAAIVAEALPATLLLALAATFVEYAVALPLGIWSARRPGTLPDHAVRTGSLVLFSLPEFWVALMAILLFAHLWPVLPPSHMASPDAARLPPAERLLDLARHLALPALVLGLTITGGTLRFVRNHLLEVLGQDYVRTARAKGLSEARVVGVHALRNALAPLLQLVGITLPSLLNGALVTEVVFSWPGIGQVTFQAIMTRDFPVLLATTTLAAALVILGNLAADLAHAVADPRLRHARTSA